MDAFGDLLLPENIVATFVEVGVCKARRDLVHDLASAGGNLSVSHFKFFLDASISLHEQFERLRRLAVVLEVGLAVVGRFVQFARGGKGALSRYANFAALCVCRSACGRFSCLPNLALSCPTRHCDR